MTSEDIRKQYWPYHAHASTEQVEYMRFACTMLKEIAAQLAEMNERGNQASPAKEGSQ